MSNVFITLINMSIAAGWLILAVVVMFGLSIVIFAISRIMPGDVATMALGSTATEEAKEA